jgi:hypothetical protein
MTWKRSPPWRTILRDRPGGDKVPPASRTPYERDGGALTDLSARGNRRARRANRNRPAPGGAGDPRDGIESCEIEGESPPG